jgi:hypothetical protein
VACHRAARPLGFRAMPLDLPDKIVCKPTPWFLLRAAAMLLMFCVFGVMFFIDGSTGYRKKNETFYLHQSFNRANEDFTKMNSGGSLTAGEWKSYAAQQTVAFPPDPYLLPKGLQQPMPWPEILQDYEKMKPLQAHLLWQEYSGKHGYNNSPPEEPYTEQKIREQWIVMGVCAVLAAVAGFFLFRTLGRSITADQEAVTTQQGKRIPYTDIKVLDLRKWDTKGLAFADYDGASGKGRIRIDGLTYGGFKKENGQPAETLMQLIRSKFSGEIIEYTAVSDSEEPEKSDVTAP